MFASTKPAQLLELPAQQSIRTSTVLSTLPYNLQGWTFLLSVFHNPSQSELLDKILAYFLEKKFTGIADTPCKRSPSAMNLSEVLLSSVWVGSNVFGDYHNIVPFLRFAQKFPYA